tara:strand:+ start:30060 stop:31490 length:1431 start_codon:yes stop_codon:yes gene_type:complete
MGKLFLIARREYLAYITAWGFWFGILITPLALFLGLSLPSLIENTQPVRYYAVIGDDGRFSQELDRQFTDRADRAAMGIVEQQARFLGASDPEEQLDQYEALREQGRTPNQALSDLFPGLPSLVSDRDFVEVVAPANDLESLFPYLTGQRTVPGPSGNRSLFAVFVVSDGEVAYWSEDVVNDSLSGTGKRALERMARTDVFTAAGVDENILQQARASVWPMSIRSPTALNQDNEVSAADKAPFFISVGFSFLLWMLIFSVVNYLLTGTIEERSNKIFDTLLTSVSLPQLLSGKLIGVLMLSLTLISIWAGSAGVMALAMRDSLPPELASVLNEAINPRLVIPTVISFILGYLMFGSIFLALGSLCDTIQEAQSLMAPIIIIMIIPFVIIPVSLANPDSIVLSILSWVPVLSPFLIILRVPNDPPLWELVLLIVWMGVFTALIIWAASRVYRAGAVHGAGMNEVRAWFGGLFKRKAA